MACSYTDVPDLQLLDDTFFCRHCKEVIPTLEYIKYHACFEGREVFLVGEQELYSPAVNKIPPHIDNSSKNTLATMTIMDDKENEVQDSNCENKQSSTLKNKETAAVWMNNATLALLALYEANMGMLDHPKKKTKIWEAIADGLRDFNIEMSSQQLENERLNKMVQRMCRQQQQDRERYC